MALMHLHESVPKDKIKKIFKEFTGKIEQLPPVRSAVKRQQRTRKIYYLELLEIKEKDVLFKVGCQAGTYIRKLIHDMGKSLKCGAHMTQLIRTKAGPFTDKTWHTLQELKDAYTFYKEGNSKEIKKVIEPIENAIEHIPKIWIFDSSVSNICHGAYLAVQGISKLNNIQKQETVAILTLKDELIGIGTSLMDSEEILKNTEGLAVKTEKIFMDRSTYPK